MKKMVCLITIALSSLFAEPCVNKHCELKQPDGSLVSVVVNGDEYYQRVESTDGYTLIRDQKDWICYAKLSDDRKSFIPMEVYTGTSKKSRGVTEQHIELDMDAVIAKSDSVKSILHKPTTSRSVAPAPVAVTGTVVGLDICIDFPDQQKTIPFSEIDGYEWSELHWKW